MYLPDTNVLITRTLDRDGVAEVSDFMPVGTDEARALATPSCVGRRASGVRSTFEVIFDPRFDYGRAGHKVDVREGEILFHSEGPDGTTVRLRSEVPLEVKNGAVVGKFVLRAGETAAFVLEQAEPGRAEPVGSLRTTSPRSFKDTVNYWRTWIGRSQYQGRWREIVNRSALVLKLLVSDDVRVARRRADVRPPRGARRRTQLGLPLHVDPRRVVHALRAHPARLHGARRARS